MSVYHGSDPPAVFGDLNVMAKFQMRLFHLSRLYLSALYRGPVLTLILWDDFRQKLPFLARVDHIQVEIVHRSVIF